MSRNGILNLKSCAALLPVCLLCFAQGIKAQPMIFPEPESVSVVQNEYIPLEKVTVSCEAPGAVEWAQKHFTEWYGKYAPEVKKGKSRSGIAGEEEYALNIDDRGVRINARTLQGVRYAMYTLRQATMPKRGTLKVEGWISPKMSVRDKPKSAFRGFHICWFRENKPWEIERMIRMAAYYKMNYAVIEPWGTFRSETAPWYCWRDAQMTKEEISRLKGIADDLGITLIPQLNVFGHATCSRGCGGKHVAFEVSPEYQPLFEPVNGWNWCLSNPEARKVIIGLLKELHEAFGCPPYIHIGGDEADRPNCAECLKRPYSELYIDHLKAINEAITGMGARTMMWHDMLIRRGDPRWEGFTACGTDETVKAATELPKDIIICDWCYKTPKESYPTMSYFKDLGYSVLTCPFSNYDGMVPQIKYAQEHDMFGVLGTVWHYFYGIEFARIFYSVSTLAWHGDIRKTDYWSPRIQFCTHLHHVCWDMKATDIEMYGLYYNDVPTEPAQNNYW